MTDLEVITCVAIIVVVVCGLAAYVWTVLTSSKEDYSVPPVFHRPNASYGPPQGSRTRVAAPPIGDVDRARRNPSGANLSLLGNRNHSQLELRERADILEPTSQD